jgi:TetR/AcrR family transcriptional regulator
MSERGPGRPAGSGGQQLGRESILAAAKELLADQGTARVTLRMVAERAGVRAPLVNYYFGSKAELFDAVLDEVGSRLRDRLQGIAAQDGTPEERFRHYIAGLIHSMAADPFAPRLIAELVFFPDDERTERFVRNVGQPNLAALVQVLEDGVASGAFDPLDPQQLAPVLLGSCFFYFIGAPALRRIMASDPLDPKSVDSYAAYVGELLLHGISASAPHTLITESSPEN